MTHAQVGLFLLLLGGPQAITGQDRVAVHDLLRALSDAQDARDAESVTRLFSGDGDVRVADEPALRGRAAILGFFKNLLAAPVWRELDTTSPPQLKTRSVRLLGNGVAVITGVELEHHGSQFGGLNFTLCMHATITLKKGDGQWGIARMRFLERQFWACPLGGV